VRAALTELEERATDVVASAPPRRRKAQT